MTLRVDDAKDDDRGCPIIFSPKNEESKMEKFTQIKNRMVIIRCSIIL
jgi:hypothetical protein